MSVTWGKEESKYRIAGHAKDCVCLFCDPPRGCTFEMVPLSVPSPVETTLGQEAGQRPQMTNATAYRLYTTGKITYGRYKEVLDSNVPKESETIHELVTRVCPNLEEK